MRELTEYEKDKWFNQYNRFNEPEFIFYGDELGEAYDAAVRCTHMSDYLSDGFVKAAETEVLDMYYAQALVYAGQYGDEPEEVGLPPLTLLQSVHPGILDNDGWSIPSVPLEDYFRAWDWAMEWREEHLNEFEERERLAFHRKEWERLQKK